MITFLVTEWMPFGLDTLRAHGQVIYDPDLWHDRARLHENIASAQALIVRNQTRVDVELLAHAQTLRVVGRLGVGLDNVDAQALRDRGIALVTAGSANAIAVAEYVLGAMLCLTRQLDEASASTHRGEWDRVRFGAGGELYGATLGLIGLGDIGARVARRALAFNMRVIAHDPFVPLNSFTPAEFNIPLLPLEEVLRQSDFVSLHLPLTPNTYHLLDETRLRLMKPKAVLINTSRGGIVDEAALARALHEGRLGGAALDVREAEPPPADDPLRGCPRALLTPHVAGLTEAAQRRVCEVVVEGVLRALGAGG